MLRENFCKKFSYEQEIHGWISCSNIYTKQIPKELKIVRKNVKK